MSEPRRIGNRFVIKELIAEGMLGAVHRGVDERTGQLVVIKTLKSDLLKERPTLLARFRREAEALRQLNHPSIVHCYDLIEQDENHYLIMEYVEGGTLYDTLQTDQGLSLEYVLETGLDLADALARAHRLGIIHRDMKPQNVLVAADGTPRLSDFGVAHFVKREGVSTPGTLVGTFFYMPPESFQGGPVNERTDIWGFGVLLFEMLAGQLPFEADTTAGLINKVISDPVPDLKALRPDLPPALYDLIALMLAKDPEDRISSVRLVGAALEAIYNGQEATLPHFEKEDRQRLSLSNLPDQATSFIGRERELGELATMFEDPDTRLVTLTGPGGVGKTRLAFQAAHQMLTRYDGGVFFIGLATVTEPERVASQIARTLNLKESGARSLVEEIGDFFRSKHSLLLLDNFEQVVEAAQTVAELIAFAPELDVLVTSREILRLYGEREYPLRPLSVPDLSGFVSPVALSETESIALFVQRAQDARPGFRLTLENAGDVAEICIRLDGLPLAIELAAARIKIFSPKYLSSQLNDMLKTLTGGPRDKSVRHQTMRAAIDWSYDLLDDEEKRLFSRLAVFRGGIPGQQEPFAAK
jgi:serine/threonine protein kinase